MEAKKKEKKWNQAAVVNVQTDEIRFRRRKRRHRSECNSLNHNEQRQWVWLEEL